MHTCLFVIFLAPGFQIDERPEKWVVSPTKEMARSSEALTLFALGAMYAREERLLLAVSTLESAALLDPEAASIQRELVPIYLSLGRADDAKISCEKVLKQEPQDYQSRFQLARLREAQGDLKGAIEDLRLGLASPHLKGAPERRYLMQTALTSYLERTKDIAGAIASEREVVAIFTRYKDQFLDNAIFTDQRMIAAQAEAYEKLGALHQSLKQFSEAMEPYKKARDLYLELKEDKERFSAVRLNWYLSDIAYQRGEFAESLKLLDSYILYQPNEKAPYSRKVELLRKLNRSAEILPMLEKEIARQSHQTGLKLIYAHELARTPGREAEAEKILEALIEKTTTNEPIQELLEMYQEQGRFQALVDRFNQLVMQSTPPEDRYSPERANAQRLIPLFCSCLNHSRELSTQTITFLVKQMKDNPNYHVRTWYLFGYLALFQEDRNSSEILLKKSLELPVPPYQRNLRPTVISDLMTLYSSARDWKKVIAFAKEELKTETQLPQLVEFNLTWNLARAQDHEGLWDESLKTIEQMLTQSQANQRLAIQCMRCDVLSRANRPAEAIHELEELLQKPLTAQEIYRVRATYSRVLQDAGKIEEAEKQLRLWYEQNPNDPLVNNNLGYFLLEFKGSLDESERLIRKAIQEDARLIPQRQAAKLPTETSAYLDSLGWVLHKQGKHLEAKEYLLRALNLSKAEDVTGEEWEHLGDVHVALKELTEAREAFDKAIGAYQADVWSLQKHKADSAKKKKEQLK